MAGLTFRLTASGLEPFRRADGKALVQAAGARLAQRLAEQTLAAADPLVPVDTGALRNSGSAQNGIVKFTAGYAFEVHGSWTETASRTQPRWVPLVDLYGWAARHQIDVYAVQRAIARNGTPIVPFLRRGYDAARAGFQAEEQAALAGLKRALLGGGP